MRDDLQYGVQTEEMIRATTLFFLLLCASPAFATVTSSSPAEQETTIAPATLPRAPLLRIATATPDSPRLLETLTVLPAYPTRESLAAVERRLHSLPPIVHAARGAAARLYDRSALKGDILDKDVALGRLALLGGNEALEAFRRLMGQPAPDGADKRWHGQIEATIKKLQESVGAKAP